MVWGIEVIASGKLTWQWKMNLFEDVFPIENGDFPLPAMLVYWSLQNAAVNKKPSNWKTSSKRKDASSWEVIICCDVNLRYLFFSHEGKK